MKPNARRLILLLAASGFNERTIKEGIEELALLGPNVVMKHVQRIRQNEAARSNELPFEETIDEEFEADPRITYVANEITRLLQDEAHLSVSGAVQQLSKALRFGQVTLNFPKFRPKEGLPAWLRRLAKTVPPSELLHHATKIRNDVMHAKDVPWPLRDRGE